MKVWHRHPFLTLAFVLAVVATVAFAVQLSLHLGPFRQPPTDPPIQSWMSPRLVAMGWDLPPEVLAPALGLAPGEGRGLTLGQIAAAQDIAFADLKARIEAAIAVWRSTQPS